MSHQNTRHFRKERCTHIIKQHSSKKTSITLLSSIDHLPYTWWYYATIMPKAMNKHVVIPQNKQPKKGWGITRLSNVMSFADHLDHCHANHLDQCHVDQVGWSNDLTFNNTRWDAKKTQKTFWQSLLEYGASHMWETCAKIAWDTQGVDSSLET